MNKLKQKIQSMAVASVAAVAMASCSGVDNDRFVILHTNDMHSQIDPSADGTGGMLRQKVVVDSVKSCVANVCVVDAGDMVQGTLYYHMYKGKVEAMMMNQVGYDMAIMGNHEFDNGMKSLLENQYAHLDAAKLASNYDLSATVLDSLFVPFVIKEAGDRRIAFLGVGLNPKGMISAGKSRGVVYHDAVSAADSMARVLKTEHNADVVVVLSHLGYDAGNSGLADDLTLAARSRSIDIIIGGHTHKTINPAKADAPVYRVANLDGDSVLIAQAGSRGQYVGEVSIDLKTLEVQSRLIEINSRLDDRIDHEAEAVLAPYRHTVDSLLSIHVVDSEVELPRDGQALVNMISDFIKSKGEELCGKHVDVALMNRGGIRNDLPKGAISKGLLMMAFPFDNYIAVMEIKGKDLIETFEKIAQRNHIGISAIDFDRIDSDKIYRLATIDYLAEGGDYLDPLTRGKEIARSQQPLVDDLVEFLVKFKAEGRRVNPFDEKRNYPIEK